MISTSLISSRRCAQLSVLALVFFALMVSIVTGADAHSSRTKITKVKPINHTSCAHGLTYVKAFGMVTTGVVGESAVECVNANGKREIVSRLYNVAQEPAKAGSPIGTYCFVLQHERALGGEVVLTSVIGSNGPSDLAPQGSTTGIPYAEWIPGASNCAGGVAAAIEINTGEFDEGPSGITKTPSISVGFSFMVP